MRTTKQFLELRQSYSIKRCHTYHVLKEQTLADHVGGMVMIHDHVSNGNVDPLVVRAILYHDMPEFVTGDMPGHMKRRLGKHFRQMLRVVEEDHFEQYDLMLPLDSGQLMMVHYCDKMDFVLFCIDEVLRGNAEFRPFYGLTAKNVKKQFDDGVFDKSHKGMYDFYWEVVSDFESATFDNVRTGEGYYYDNYK